MCDTIDFSSDSDVVDDASRREITSDTDSDSVPENLNGNRKDDSDSVEEEDEISGANINNKVEKISKNKRKKNSNVELPTKKIGPQRQKKEIHTYLKKAKKYEIRKLTRRIAILRNLKGSDEQKAKNNRKVESLLHEIQAMKEFLINQLTERTVDIFKGKSEQIYLDMWTAAQDHKEFEKMLQSLSKSSDEKKYENMAFLRMISSKDIVRRLKLINSGTNIIKPKSRKALRKQLRKFNQRNKKLRKRDIPQSEDIKNFTDPSMEIDGEIVEDSKLIKSGNAKKSKVVTFSPNPVVKKVKKFSDPFFLPDSNLLDSDGDDDISSDEEFSAPIQEIHETLPKKKNRMGQRMRKNLLEKEQMNSKEKRKGSTRHIQKQRTHAKTQKQSLDICKDTVDKELHPSWQAKKRQKAQQGISAFSGTKITFDD